MEIWKTAARADGKAIHSLMGKDRPFPTASQFWQFTHIPTTPTTAAIHPFLSNPKKYYGNPSLTEVQFVPLFK